MKATKNEGLFASDAPPAPGAWCASPAALAAMLARPACARLDELGVIEARGADAIQFVHDQLSQDVLHLAPGEVRLAAYCNPQGRMLASLELWRSDQAVYLQLPRELVAPVMKRLSMYVLRAKVVLSDVSDHWNTWALFGPAAAVAAAVGGGDGPAAQGTIDLDGALLTRARPAPQLPDRWLLRIPHERLGAWRKPLAAFAPIPAAAWWWSQIDAGVPTVLAATQGRFVPQMINFEVLGGVNFRKGCFPGQEVVARSQYLGKLRRRMGIAQVDADTSPGADLYASGAPQAVGTVVNCAPAPGGAADLLFECPVQALDSGSLHLAGPDGPALRIRPLPYELVDVTA